MMTVVIALAGCIYMALHNTGYQANLGTIAGLAGPDDILVIDADSHAGALNSYARAAPTDGYSHANAAYTNTTNTNANGCTSAYIHTSGT